MNESKFAAYVGFAQKSGKIVYGAEKIEECAVKCKVVVADADAPEKFRVKLQRICGDTPYFEVGSLSGATHRDNVKAIAVTDKSLADAIINVLR